MSLPLHHLQKTSLLPNRSVFAEVPAPHEIITQLEAEMSPAFRNARDFISNLQDASDSAVDKYICAELAITERTREKILAGITDPNKEKKLQKANANLNLAINYVNTRFRQHVKKTFEEVREIKRQIKLQFFVIEKTGLIPEESGLRASVAAAIEGLIGKEKDENKWQEIYSSALGWSDAELAELTAEQIRQKIPSAVVSEDLDRQKTPETDIRLNAMLSRAQQIYGEKDPAFVEQYRNYLLYTANLLKAKNRQVTDADFKEAALCAEDYFRLNFTGFEARPEGALTGSEFISQVLGIDPEKYKKNPRQLGKLNREEIQNAILLQIELGNIPDFLRQPKAIQIPRAKGGSVTVYVMPDVMAIGSDKDYLRVPITPVVAQALALRQGLSLPTKTIVEQIYQEAGRTGHQTIGPNYFRGPEDSGFLDSPGFYIRHSREIDDLLEESPPGTLTSGGKKELVVAPGAAAGDGTIHFYGLRDDQGRPIQTTSAHGGAEGGYKHTEYPLGIRYCADMVVVRDDHGVERVMPMHAALMDAEIASDLSRGEWYRPNPAKKPTYINRSEGPFDPRKAYDRNATGYNTSGLLFPS